MKFSIRKIASLLLGVAMTFSLMGCENSLGGENATDPEGEEIVEEVKTDFINLQMREPDSLDPLLTSRQSVRDGLLVIYEPLFNVTKDFGLENVLAETYAFNENATIMTLKLKEGVLWHNGTPLTADDVIYTVGRIKANSACSYYLNLKSVDRVEKENDYTVVFYLNEPNVFLPYSLYFPIMHIAAGENHIGTGPFMFEKTDGKSLTLTKNPFWHKGEVESDGVKFLYLRNAQMAQEAFSSGKIHAVTKDMLDVENFAIKKSQTKYYYPSGVFEFVGFNAQEGIFSDALLRIAASQAIDRKKMESVYEAAIGGGFPIMIGSEAFSPSYETAGYNLDYAKEVIFSAGWTDVDYDMKPEKVIDNQLLELTFDLLVADVDVYRKNAAEEIRTQLEKAGFGVNVIYCDIDTFNEKISSGEYDAFLGAMYYDAPYDVSNLLSSDGSLRFNGYSSAEMDLALAKFKSSADKDISPAAFVKVQSLFEAYQPIAGLVFRTTYVVTSPAVEGDINPYPYSPYANISKWNIK